MEPLVTMATKSRRFSRGGSAAMLALGWKWSRTNVPRIAAPSAARRAVKTAADMPAS